MTKDYTITFIIWWLIGFIIISYIFLLLTMFWEADRKYQQLRESSNRIQKQEERIIIPKSEQSIELL